MDNQLYQIYECSEQHIKIIWNVEKIALSKCANGYIVQTVRLMPEDQEPLNYLEAWKVNDGITSHGINGHLMEYDDMFYCKEKGHPAKYTAKVYWISIDDPKCKIIDEIPYGKGEYPWGTLQGTIESDIIYSIINGQESLCDREFNIKG